MIRKESIHPMLPEIGELGETYINLPFSDFRRWVKEGDIAEQILDNLPMGRLIWVKTLSLVSYKASFNEINSQFQHSRFSHSLLVGLLLGEILKQNHFSQKEISTGILAGFIHDIATPALGDATKKVDPKALDEENSWWKTLDKKAQKFITQQLDLPKEILDEIIKNKGIMGQVLDIADRIVYVMQDLRAIVPMAEKIEDTYLPFLAINRYLNHHPKFGNIYQDVRVDKEKQKVFFSDPAHLETFLLFRMHLYNEMYLNPANQGRDLLMARLIQPLYSRNRNTILNPQKLRGMNDFELLDELRKYYVKFAPFPKYLSERLMNLYLKFEQVKSQEEAGKMVEKLRTEKDIAVIGIEECNGLDPATSYNVTNKKTT